MNEYVILYVRKGIEFTFEVSADTEEEARLQWDKYADSLKDTITFVTISKLW